MNLPMKDLTRARSNLHHATGFLETFSEIAYEALSEGHRGQLLVALQLLGDLRGVTDTAWERQAVQQELLVEVPA